MPLHIICVIEANLNEPHIDHDNGPQAWNNCIWVSIYVSFTPHLSHLGSWDSCTPWNASCIPVHWHAHVHELQLHSTQRSMLNWTARKTGATCTCVCHKDHRWRQVGECTDTWYKWIQPTETGNTETKRGFLRYQTQWQSTPRGKLWSLFLLWQLIGIDWWQEENVEPFRLTVLRHHWHCCICRSSYYHNIISPGSPPVFLECTSNTYLIIHFHLNKAFNLWRLMVNNASFGVVPASHSHSILLVPWQLHCMNIILEVTNYTYKHTLSAYNAQRERERERERDLQTHTTEGMTLFSHYINQ